FKDYFIVIHYRISFLALVNTISRTDFPTRLTLQFFKTAREQQGNPVPALEFDAGKRTPFQAIYI
ncbi:MAG: hypothetical protein WBL59_03025, partial [Bacillota bacterium]